MCAIAILRCDIAPHCVSQSTNYEYSSQWLLFPSNPPTFALPEPATDTQRVAAQKLQDEWQDLLEGRTTDGAPAVVLVIADSDTDTPPLQQRQLVSNAVTDSVLAQLPPPPAPGTLETASARISVSASVSSVDSVRSDTPPPPVAPRSSASMSSIVSAPSSGGSFSVSPSPTAAATAAAAAAADRSALMISMTREVEMLRRELAAVKQDLREERLARATLAKEIVLAGSGACLPLLAS